MRVEVKPELLRWAGERSMIERDALEERFPKLREWEARETWPTLKQLEAFARATHTPIGFLFLQEPPEERLPIPDFRTIRSARIRRPSPDLLDTIYLCQQRQDWYSEFARMEGEDRLPFVGSATIASDIVATASEIRDRLKFSLDERRLMPSWTEALRRFIELADNAGVLVMVSGVVGSNSHRKLDPDEFRGFTLADQRAPLVFINGSDTKAAQMFTLAHELAHVWLGETGVSDERPSAFGQQGVERWCNEVAAELLVPAELFRNDYDATTDLASETQRLARRFKVSTLVILRRMFDTGGLSHDLFQAAYAAELRRLMETVPRSGGNFYVTLGARASKRFTRALVVSTLEGRSTYTEALRLLAFKKMSTFRELGQTLGLAV
ncbi:MAG TPA: ImmA/IrrE family metallo-endopeptidase [Thermoanaerobaculia bacterium]